MKLIVEKEKDGLFFAKLDGFDDVYAQGETMEEAIENLWSVYEEVMNLKKELLLNKLKEVYSVVSNHKLELTI